MLLTFNPFIGVHRVLLPLVRTLVASLLANRGGHTTITSIPRVSPTRSGSRLEIASLAFDRSRTMLSLSETQEAACSFDLGTAEDVGVTGMSACNNFSS